jgi:hypothetical protein
MTSSYGNYGVGLRDAGNGANDTAGAYGFVLNAYPDREKTREAQTAKAEQSMYPPVSPHDPRYRLAVKGMHAFKDMRWNHISESEFRNDIDMVNYMDNLAGLFSKSEKPWQILPHLTYVGVVKNDVLNMEGAGKDNTLGWSEKSTRRHTGNARMMSGQAYYWDLPPTNNEMYSGGASKMDDVPEGQLPIWTMPYDPVIHRGSPELIYRAITEMSGKAEYSEYLLHKQSLKWLDAVINSGLVVASILVNKASPMMLKLSMRLSKNLSGLWKMTQTFAMMSSAGCSTQLAELAKQRPISSTTTSIFCRV